MLKRVPLAAVLMLAGSVAAADTCRDPQFTCAQYGTTYVSGMRVDNACLSVVRTETCTRSDVENSCSVLQPLARSPSSPLRDGQCKLTARDCVRYAAGQCDRYKESYTCWNGPREIPPASLQSRVYRNFAENIASTCSTVEADLNCRLETTIDVEGAATRDINTRMIARGWWKKELRYDCTNKAYEDTCGDYAGNPICKIVGEPVCLEQTATGGCIYEEVAYECDSDPSFEANCAPISVCVGDNCNEIAEEPGEGLPAAAAWLSFLGNAADENNCEARADVDPENFDETDCINQQKTVCEPNNTAVNMAAGIAAPLVCQTEPVDPSMLQVFNGKVLGCRLNGLMSCCNSGGFNNCKTSEFDLRSYMAAKTTHYLGTRCTDRFFGLCIMRMRDYCVYESKLGRVFQEQANKQIGDRFLPYGSPDRCPSLTIEQLESLNMAEIDLSEIYGDMVDQTEFPLQDALVDQLNNQLGVTADDVQATFE